MSGANWIRLLIVGIGLVGAGLMVVIVYLARTRCPACRKPTLELDLRDNPGGIDASREAIMFRCGTCGAEYRRAGRGPFIPRAAWEAGARDEIPKARARPSRR